MIVASSSDRPAASSWSKRRGSADVKSAARLENAGKGQDPHARFALGAAAELRVDDDQDLEERQVLPAAEDLVELGPVFDENHAALGVAQDESHLFGRRVGAAGHVGRPDGEYREVGDDPLLAVVRDDADVVSPLDAQGEEAAAEGPHERLELSCRNSAELARGILGQKHGQVGVAIEVLVEPLCDRVAHGASRDLSDSAGG